MYDAEPDGKDPWRWRPALESAGFGRSDVVLNAFAYHLTPAGAMFEETCRQLGATMLPGVGNIDAQMRACAALGVTAYVGLPSYLKALLEAADALPSSGAFVDTARLRDGRTAARVPAAWLLERLDVALQGYAPR